MIHLAFLWHFHQPCYLDQRTRVLHMPWVRLHGTKDYTGMALLMEEFPKIRATANFSPGLLDQVLAYGTGAEDTVLRAVRKPPDALTDEEREFLRRQLFFVNRERHILRVPRYGELEARVQGGAPLSTQDWLDLETLNALAWIHPVAADELIRRLNAKGQDFTIEERDAVLARHIAMAGEVIPRWRKLHDAGRVEISLSPYYHPILPLLCDFESARRALPDTPTPPLGKTLSVDAREQVMRARRRGEELFGRAPVGCWPSEGSVSPEAVSLLAELGFRWFAADQAILEKSGRLNLYWPYPVGGATAVFRDSALSNLLGFVYKSWDPKEAAADFVKRVEALGAEEDRLVVVALDGENAWENYVENAVPFFRELYSRLSTHSGIRTVTMTEGIAAVKSGEPIQDLWSGSWINANYAVWMGHEEDRIAWQLLADVRGRLGEPGKGEAWESLYRAEGSDWFWWFGEDYSSPQDAEFDAIFRRHLANACAIAGIEPPEGISRPVRKRRGENVPNAAISVTVDGRQTDYFEWSGAGRYETAREFGAMAGELMYVAAIAFGCDARHLFIRLDFRLGVEPALALGRNEVRVAGPFGSISLHPVAPGVETAEADFFEASIPLASLGVGPGEAIEFHVEIGRTRLPAAFELRAVVPSADQLISDWRA